MLKSAFLSLLVLPLFAQTYTINTIAGNGPSLPLNTLTYALHDPQGIAVDSAGNYYIALPDWCRVWIVNSSGVLTGYIGNGICGYTGDNGPAASASLREVRGIAVDPSGANIYISDTFYNVIRKVNNGIITTVAGNGVYGYNGDGVATASELRHPYSLSLDGSGNLYIADTENCLIRKLTGTTISTFAGVSTITCGYNGDNILATTAQLNGPFGVAVDGTGANVYIADSVSNRIRKVSISTNMITSVAGNSTAGYAEGSALGAVINQPLGVAADSVGNFYIADTGNGRIRQVSNGTISSIGTGFSTPSAVERGVEGITFNAGSVYVADTENNRIAKVTSGIVSVVVGNGANAGGDKGPASSALLSTPASLAMDSAGDIFVADQRANVIRMIAAGSGMITTVAGSGVCSATNIGDGGPPLSASFCDPRGVAVDSTGTTIYIADTYHNRIRKVLNGTITTIAGNGTSGYNGDGITAITAQVYNPGAVALAPNGDVYIADTNNCAVRKVSGTTISTVAGVPASAPGSCGYNQEGTATNAQLSSPTGVFVDSTGSNVYIADSGNSRIRKVTGATISTVAGNVTAGFGGDGQAATSAQLNLPYTVILDTANNMYIADSKNFRIRKVTGGIINTIAGSSSSGFSGDGGQATNAQLSGPWGLAVDANSNVYLADSTNQGASTNERIRELLFPVTTCTYSMPSGATAIAGSSSGGFALTASSSSCPWTATSNMSFLTLNGGSTSSGMGSANINYNVQANGLGEGQTGVITVTGTSFSQTFTVTQSGLGCAVTFTPTHASLGVGASSNNAASISMPGSDCTWTTSSGVPPPSWITVTPGSGTNTGAAMSYSLSSNTSSSVSRSGAITIGVSPTGTQAAFNVDQAGALCVYSLAQSNQSFPSIGGPGSTAVAAPGGCLWTASSNVPWVTGLSIVGGNGPGNGSVSYTVQSNPSSVARTATLTVAGQSYGVTQAGTATPLSCSLSTPLGAPGVALEGRTEVIGDVVITCNNLSSAITGNILLTLNASVTNLVTSGLSDATLCQGSTACNSGVPTNQLGQVVGYNALQWSGVTLTPSGGIASVRITNVRADASSLTLPPGQSAVSITGQLSVTSPVSFPVPNTSLTLANAASTLSFQVGSPSGGTQSIYPLTFQEVTPTSFHTSSGSTPATRLRVVVSGLPQGVTVFAPIYPTGGATQGQLYTADCSGNLGGPATGVSMAGGTYFPTSVTTATWVVLSATSSLDALTFPLLLSNPSNVDVSKVQFSGTYGPVSPAQTACGDPSAKVVPRYRDFSAPQTATVSLRLSTSIGATRTSGSVAPRVKVDLRGQRITTNATAKVKDLPLDSTPSTQVSFMDNLTNSTTNVTVTNAVVTGNVPTGNNLITPVMSGSGTFAQSGDGQYSCTFFSIAPGGSVSCGGYGAEDNSYTGDSVTNSATTRSDQPAGDLSSVVSSSTFVVTGPSMQIEVPSLPMTTSGTPVPITGWAVDQYTKIGSVQIMVDNVVVGNATYGGTLMPTNPNIINEYFGWVGVPNIGFSYILDPNCPGNTTPCVALSPGPHNITAIAYNSVVPPQSQAYTPAVPLTVTFNNNVLAQPTKVGVFRGGSQFLEDSNGNRMYDAGGDTFFPNFTGPNGFQSGDYPVAGDWTGDGRAKVGIYRSSTGQWFLDANNNGVYDAADFTYGFGGITGDLPMVGDWLGTGKSCIGIFRQGFYWLLDLNCDGSFDGAKDAQFPFGGVGGDVPVVGAWTGGATKVGVVRKYAPAGVPIGNPFYWVLDAGAANAGSTPMSHQPDYGRLFAFGGAGNEVFLTGDWYKTGTSGAAVYRSGLWLLDAALPGDPQINHSQYVQFNYGGTPTDVPIVGKW